MKKRITGALTLILALILIMLCAPVMAEEEMTEGTFSFIPEEEGISGEEALSGYIREVMGIRSSGEGIVAGAKTYAGERLSGAAKMLYDDLVPRMTQVAEGQLSSAEFTYKIQDLWPDGFTAEDLGVSSLSGKDVDTAFSSALRSALDASYHALLVDCPYEMYWHDKSRTGGYRTSFRYGKTIKSDRVYYTGELTLQFKVSSEFSVSGSTGTTEIRTEVGQYILTAKDNAAAIVEANAGGTDLEKLTAYKNAICEMTDYNYTAAQDYTVPYGNPWQLIYVFDGDPDTKVVCEGYSKAFKYLCDMSSLKSARVISVSGIMGDSYSSGRHMWNIVNIDGKNYMADITNSEPRSLGMDGSLFLTGYTLYEDDAYYYKCVSGYSTYCYDESMYNIYGSEYLEMSAEDYGQPAEEEEEETTEPRKKVEAFVKRCYNLILNRGADAAGLENWVSTLMDGSRSASEIIYGFMYSGEFTGRNLSSGDAVEILYQAMLNRGSDAAGKETWVNKLSDGYDYVDIINGFCGSGEFTALCNEYGITPGSVVLDNDYDKVAAFVKRCYRLILKRGADEEGLNTWVSNLKQGTRTASEIIYGFMYSNEYTGRGMSNSATVEILYRVMLDRGSDAEGKANWLERLGKGETVVAIINGFCGSQEFIGLCKNYGIEPGSVKTEEATALSKAVKAVKKAPDAEAEIGETGNGNEESETENAETGTENKETGTGNAETGTENEETGTENKESGTESEENGTENKETGTENKESGTESEVTGTENKETGTDETGEAEAEETSALLGEAVQESALDEDKAREFAARCYRAALDRDADEAELAGWVGQIVTGGKKPEKIVRGFLFSDEFKARNLSNEEIVKILYRIYMNREADPEGLAFWRTQLDGGMSLEDAVKGFAASDEFRAILREMKK